MLFANKLNPEMSRNLEQRDLFQTVSHRDWDQHLQTNLQTSLDVDKLYVISNKTTSQSAVMDYFITSHNIALEALSRLLLGHWRYFIMSVIKILRRSPLKIKPRYKP